MPSNSLKRFVFKRASVERAGRGGGGVVDNPFCPFLILRGIGCGLSLRVDITAFFHLRIKTSGLNRAFFLQLNQAILKPEYL